MRSLLSCPILSLAKTLICGRGDVTPPIEYVQNGDMSSATGWSGDAVPAAGELVMSSSQTTNNTLLQTLPVGAQGVLRYTAGVSFAAVTVSLVGAGVQSITDLGNGTFEVSFVANEDKITLRITTFSSGITITNISILA